MSHPTNGSLVPLVELRTGSSATTGPVTINQTGQLVSTTVSFNLPAGEALSDATAAIDQIKKDISMPADVFTSYGGTAQIFQQSQGNTPIPDPGGGADDLCRSRRALRELHPPADHSLRSAGGRSRRACWR